MTLLDNPKVKEFFGCRHTGNLIDHDGACSSAIAFRVLQAMQEPIKKRDRYLYVDRMQVVWEPKDGWKFESYPDFHGDYLRLPDAYQKRECDNDKQQCTCECHDQHQPPHDAVCQCEHPKASHQPKSMKWDNPDFGRVVCGCCQCGRYVPKSNAVEEKIKSICGKMPVMANVQFLEDALCELVRLARRGND